MLAKLRNSVILSLAVLVTGCGRFTYSVEAVNYGQHGVILLNVPVTGDGARDRAFPRTYRLSPGLPTVADDVRDLGLFENHGNSLPDEIEIVWQIAELSGCETIVPAEGSVSFEKELRKHGYDPADYIRREGCSWSPIDGAIHRKTFYMEAVRKTAAYRRTGSWYEGIGGSRYVLRLRFEFRDEEAKLVAYNEATNPWK